MHKVLIVGHFNLHMFFMMALCRPVWVLKSLKRKKCNDMQHFDMQQIAWFWIWKTHYKLQAINCFIVLAPKWKWWQISQSHIGLGLFSLCEWSVSSPILLQCWYFSRKHLCVFLRIPHSNYVGWPIIFFNS